MLFYFITKVPMLFLTFDMFAKIWFLSYGPKTSKSNQNAGFFKLQYLLGYEVEYLDMTSGSRKH